MSGRTDAVTDVRIVVEGLADAIRVSEALRGTSLGSDYGATVTALIPTTTPDIAKNAAFGADIVLLATDHDEAGDQLSVRMREVLEGLCGTVEQVRLPRGQNIVVYRYPRGTGSVGKGYRTRRPFGAAPLRHTRLRNGRALP
jgi:predicted nuclease with TOPRIM domain